MYNRYIPGTADYGPIPAGDSPSGPSREHPSGGSPRGGLNGLLGSLFRSEGESNRVSQTLSSLLKSLHLESLELGDILLALIVLFLILEDGDDLDLIITLGLMILFSLGEPSGEAPSHLEE